VTAFSQHYLLFATCHFTNFDACWYSKGEGLEPVAQNWWWLSGLFKSGHSFFTSELTFFSITIQIINYKISDQEKNGQK
jgi:hypothetical protein